MKYRMLALALLLAGAGTTPAAEDLLLNGSGIRTKPILGAMYELALWVPPALQGAEAKALLEADQPMTLVLNIQSRLITRARFVEATREGFAKAAESGYAAAQTQLFLDQFAGTEFRKGDIITMRYAFGALTTLYRKAADGAETVLGVIPGPELKRALFAIWLGTVPVQESLKRSLLDGAK